METQMDFFDELGCKKQEGEELIMPNLVEKVSLNFNFKEAHIVKQPDFLVEKLLPLNQIGTMCGDSGNYKSVLGLKMASCVATGIPFMGREVKKGKVFYGSFEDTRNIELYRAINMFKNDPLFQTEQAKKDLENNLTIADFCTEYVNFDDDKNIEDLNNKIISGGYILAIFDTLRAFSSELKENESDSITQLFTKLSQMKNSATILFLHHNNKQGSFRGSTAILANSRFMIEVKKVENSEDLYQFEVSKSNYGVKGKITRTKFKVEFDNEKGIKFNIVHVIDSENDDKIDLKLLGEYLQEHKGVLVMKKLYEYLYGKKVSGSKVDKFKNRIEQIIGKENIENVNKGKRKLWDGTEKSVQGFIVNQIVMDKIFSPSILN
jgi:AAA domain